MSDDKMPVKIWQPFKSENYKYSWHDKNILGIISQFFTDIKYCWQRCIRGYCDFDIYSIDFWFRDIMPHMLVQLRDTIQDTEAQCLKVLMKKLHMKNGQKF